MLEFMNVLAMSLAESHSDWKASILVHATARYTSNSFFLFLPIGKVIS